jgi:F-type H+/Na+-transporting ATPase subunit alpha
LPLAAVAQFRAKLPAVLDRDAPEFPSVLAKTGELDDDTRKGMMDVLARFVTSLSDDTAPAKP